MQEVSWVQDNRICGLKGYCSQLVDELENHDRRATDAFEDLQEDRDVMRSRFEVCCLCYAWPWICAWQVTLAPPILAVLVYAYRSGLQLQEVPFIV